MKDIKHEASEAAGIVKGIFGCRKLVLVSFSASY